MEKQIEENGVRLGSENPEKERDIYVQ